MGVKEKPDITNITDRKRLQWYGHVKKDARRETTKINYGVDTRGKKKKEDVQEKTWMEGVRAAMKTRHLEADQWLNRKECRLGSGRRRQLSQDRKDR